MKKLLLLLLLIPNLVMAELTPKPKGKPLVDSQGRIVRDTLREGLRKISFQMISQSLNLSLDNV